MKTKENKIKFFHFRLKQRNSEFNSHGGITLAIKKNNDILKFASAVCSIKDNYCKKIGRAIAEGRLIKNASIFTLQKTDNNINMSSLIKMVLNTKSKRLQKEFNRYIITLSGRKINNGTAKRL